MYILDFDTQLSSCVDIMVRSLWTCWSLGRVYSFTGRYWLTSYLLCGCHWQCVWVQEMGTPAPPPVGDRTSSLIKLSGMHRTGLISGEICKRITLFVSSCASENLYSKFFIECVSHPQNYWKYFNSVSEKPVTRSDFMSVLSNIEYILIKASYGQGLQQSRYVETSRI